MVKKPKKQGADIVLDKDGKVLSTQPNQITDLHIVPTLYTERAMDELVWALQPFYAAAKRKENKSKDGTQLMIPFNNEDAYLVTPDRANTLQHEGDFVATIRFRDLPGITPRHYGELRQVLDSMKKIDAEVHTKDGVLYTNFIDIIAEYETHETINPRTGEKMVVKSNNLKRNEVKIRIRKEILENKFFLTESGYTQFYFPTTRHTKTATANRLYKWLSKWRGIKKDQMVEIVEQQPDGTERTVGRIIFRADYIEVRSVCGLFNSQDGKVVNGENVEQLAITMVKNDGKQWDRVGKAEQKRYIEQARQRASEKYAYYSEFAKRYLAQAKKELDELSDREIADFTFDYRAIFADGRSKGKVPLQVEFTLTIFDLGRQLYEHNENSSKEIEARTMMKERLAMKAEQINDFIRRLKPGDIDHMLVKINYLIDINMSAPRDDVQHWACRCLNTFFEKELPSLRLFTPAEEITDTPGTAPASTFEAAASPGSPAPSAPFSASDGSTVAPAEEAATPVVTPASTTATATGKRRGRPRNHPAATDPLLILLRSLGIERDEPENLMAQMKDHPAALMDWAKYLQQYYAECRAGLHPEQKPIHNYGGHALARLQNFINTFKAKLQAAEPTLDFTPAAPGAATTASPAAAPFSASDGSTVAQAFTPWPTDPATTGNMLHFTTKGDASEKLQSGIRHYMGDAAQWFPAYDDIASWYTDNQGRGLLCMGGCGLGKTRICKDILPKLFQKDFQDRLQITAVNATDMVPRIDKLLASCKRTGVIIIDDLGTEPTEAWVNYRKRNVFFELVNAAEQSGTLLIITTNLPPASLQSRYGARVFDRLRSNTRCVAFNGPSLRK